VAGQGEALTEGADLSCSACLVEGEKDDGRANEQSCKPRAKTVILALFFSFSFLLSFVSFSKTC
jgi:hypothetical protein